MMTHYGMTQKNAQSYYTAHNHSMAAKLCDNTGYMADIYTPDRDYHIVTRIMKDAKQVVIEVSPGLYCSTNETRNMMNEYINRVNTLYLTGAIKINSSGGLYVQMDQSFKDAPVSKKMFKSMENIAITILHTFLGVLEKISQARLLEPDELDPSTVIENHRKEVFERSIEPDEPIFPSSIFADTPLDPHQHNSSLDKLIEGYKKDKGDDLISILRSEIEHEAGKNIGVVDQELGGQGGEITGLSGDGEAEG